MSQTIKGLTPAGQELKAKLEAYAFQITRIVAGAAACEDPLGLTEVLSPRQEFYITRRVQQEASAILYTKLTNEGLEQGYSMWQIGIYAKGPETPEILYRIIQFDAPRPVPARSDAGFEYKPTIYITTANSDQITVNINPDWTDEAAAEAQKRADEAYALALEAMQKAAEGGGNFEELQKEIEELHTLIGIMPLDGGTFFDEYEPFAADGGNF